jgi:hypothetical protein
LLEGENQQLKSSAKRGKRGGVLQAIHPNGSIADRGATKSYERPSVEVKAYREIHADGSITRLRGWFFTDPEVKALYNNPDKPIRRKFRDLIHKLTNEEQRVFYKKATSSPVQYRINPEQNDGLNYAYAGQAERRKAERHKLLGFSCEECDAVGPMVTGIPTVADRIGSS